MKLRDFRIGWRLLAQQPAYSAITIIGLAVALAACFLVLSVLLFAFRFDHHIPEVERVYIAKTRLNWEQSRTAWRENIPMPSLRGAQQSGLPFSATRVMEIGVEPESHEQSGANFGGVPQALRLTLADPAFPDIFGVQTVAGDLAAALSRPDALALTEESSQRLFHGVAPESVPGRSLHLRGQAFQVLAIVRDPQETTSVPYAALAGMQSAAWGAGERQDFLDSWKNFEGRLYLKLAPGLAPEKVAGVLEQTIQQSPLRSQLNAEDLQQLGQQKLLNVSLGRLTDSFLDDVGTSGNRSRKFDAGIILVLAAIALLLLVLAVSNYISLTTIRTIARQREIALRKVLGASGARIFAQITAESMLTAALAAALGLLLAWLLLPGFAYFVNFRLENLLTPVIALVGSGLALMLALLTGAVAGAYPARLAIRTPPAQILSGRGNSDSRHSSWLRHLVTVGQFAIGMCLASVALTFGWQTHFARTADRGFDPAPILALEFGEERGEEQAQPRYQVLRDAVSRLPGVTAVAMAREMIGQTAVNRVTLKRADGSRLHLRKKLVGPEYFQVFGVHALAGRVFDPKLEPQDKAGVVVLEQAAVAMLGFPSDQAALGQIVDLDGEALTVVGVTPTILLDSIVFSNHTPPVVYMISRKANTMLIRASGDAEALRSQVERLREQHIPHRLAPVSAIKMLLDANIKDAQMVTTVVSVATVAALLLAGFGMYISSATSLQKRSREVVLRKLYGARPVDIAGLLAREFATLTALAAALGLPVAYVLGRLFVEHSSKQAPVGLWPVALALAGGVLLALLASYRHTALAMRISPAQALRS